MGSKSKGASAREPGAIGERHYDLKDGVAEQTAFLVRAVGESSMDREPVVGGDEEGRRVPEDRGEGREAMKPE